MTRIVAPWLNAPGVQRVAALLEQGGHRALFVGGCVRNALLGGVATDIDLATDAPPARVIALMERAGFAVVPTGLAHGTVTVLSDHAPIEVTTFRRDLETDGRHAVVDFSDDVAEDAARRDFTMNALYCDRTGRLVDPLGGIEDLRQRRLRFVGDPEARVREDYLRILRFFRFHAWYADPRRGLDPAGLAACARHAAGLGRISAERIGSEMRKLLSARDPAPAVAAMERAGVLAQVLPGAQAGGAQAGGLSALVALERGHDLAPDPVLRLAVLGGEAPDTRLRLSRSEARRLAALAGAARSDAGLAVLGYRLGASDGLAAALARLSLAGAPAPTTLRARIARGAEAVFPVAAADLMGQIAPGPALGARLRGLEARWIASDFALSRDELLREAADD